MLRLGLGGGLSPAISFFPKKFKGGSMRLCWIVYGPPYSYWAYRSVITHDELWMYANEQTVVVSDEVLDGFFKKYPDALKKLLEMQLERLRERLDWYKGMVRRIFEEEEKYNCDWDCYPEGLKEAVKWAEDVEPIIVSLEKEVKFLEEYLEEAFCDIYEREYYAIVDENGKIVRVTCNECCRTFTLIFPTEEDAKEFLDVILDGMHEELKELKELASDLGRRLEDFEDYSILVESKRYYEKCKIKKIKIIFDE